MLLLVSVAWASPPPPLASEMHARYTVLTEARDAVVRGQLPEAKAAIAPLAVHDAEAPFPPKWQPWVRQVEAAAKTVVAAPDLAAAATAVARTAVACAGCHMETGSGPSLEGVDMPAQTFGPGQNMALHQWAADWMWVGLLSGDDAAWLRGATELNNQPLPFRFEDAPPPGGRRELEQVVYLVAGLALTTETEAGRAELYGGLLATCSQCHSQRKEVPHAR